jgi:hypothetical protein
VAISGTANATACDAWKQQDSGACGACVASASESASAWGPVVCDSASACTANSGGCVDLLTGTVADEVGQGGAGSCGDLFAVAASCESFACASCFANDTELTQCYQSATANECQSYDDATKVSNIGPCVAVNADASAVAVCFPGTDAEVNAFVNVFCGTGP